MKKAVLSCNRKYCTLSQQIKQYLNIFLNFNILYCFINLINKVKDVEKGDDENLIQLILDIKKFNLIGF